LTHEEAFKPLDAAIWEMGEGFGGLADSDVWVRAHPHLLSVGELAAHVAFWEVHSILGSFDSPLATEGASYYPDSVAAPWNLEMGAEDLYAEVQRVHAACRAHILEARPDLEAVNPLRSNWTWGGTLEYTAFHIAYHTGQIYSVRHLLGHETPDN
jgi:uncharacterized damage-inducible protein DinB